MQAQPIRTHVRDHVLTVTIDRPERLNAIDRPAAQALCDAFAAARDDDAIKAIVLTGVGRGFCAAGIVV